MLFQVVFHSAARARSGASSTMADVLAASQREDVRRHPHVFGGGRGRRRATRPCRSGSGSSAREGAPDGSPRSALAGVPARAAALLRAQRLQVQGRPRGLRLAGLARGLGEGSARRWRSCERAAARAIAARVSVRSSATCCSRSSTWPGCSASMPRTALQRRRGEVHAALHEMEAEMSAAGRTVGEACRRTSSSGRGKRSRRAKANRRPIGRRG